MNPYPAKWTRHFVVSSCLLFSWLSTPLLHANNDEDDWSLGPVGGTFRVQPGTGFLRVQSMPSGTPGQAAGLLPGDMIHGAFGEPFGTTLTNATAGGYKGAVHDLATAIDFAEDWDGVLPLQVLRPGVVGFTANVQLTPVGAFGAAYPRGCPKYQAMYEAAVAGIHALIAPQSNPNFTNSNGRFGLILLSHPDWNSTTAPRPYRTSINKLRDRAITVINNTILQPVKHGQPGYVHPGLENWELSTQVMFLAEYVNRTQDTSATVTNALQRGVQCLENRIQTGGSQGSGHMGHGGVEGDYGNWGLNIINVYTHAAFAMAKRAGVQPDQAKWDMSWEYLKRSTARSNGHIEDGYVAYGAPAWGQGHGWDASGRTAGSVFAFLNYGQTPTADDTDVLNRMKGYLVRNYHRMQHAHAYTAGGVLFYQLALPYLPDRDQRYFMENTRYFYQFHRTTGSGLQYFGGRLINGGDSNGGYLGYDLVKLYNVAIAGAVANRGLPSIPAENSDRLFLRFRAPMLKWPHPEARAGVVRGTSASFVTQITDADGNTLAPGDYTAAWTHVSGPGSVTFSNPSAADSTATFSTDGRHRVQLTVTRGSYSLVELIDLDVFTGDPPPGFTTGQAQYQVYTGIGGTSVANLTSNAKFPNNSDISTTVSRLEGTHSGDNYGARIRGFIIPPATGEYRFYIASDDASQFRFGTSKAAATVICSVSGHTEQYHWTANSSQTSAIQNLTAGTPYFFEALHKEGLGGDHVAVAWTGPGWTTPQVIEGRYLTMQSGGLPEIVGQPSSRSVAAGGSTSFTAQVSSIGPVLFQWRRNGVAHWPASPNPQLALTNLSAAAAGQYDVVVTTPEGTVTSESATLTVTGAGAPVAGGLWRDFYSGISGTTVADLTNAPAYPSFPSSGGIITTAEAPANVADNYGQRWTGWLTPDTTGNHRFFIASDDASELWLSTNDQLSNRVRIAWVNGWTAARAWSSGGQSALIPLVAGNRYYIEVRHKEGSGGDSCAVAWQRPGDSVPANGSAPIPGQYLSTLQGGIFDDMAATITLQNPQTSNVNIPENVGLLLSATASPASPGAAISWAQTSGPGTAHFTDPGALTTGVTFDTLGSYELVLTYNNGLLPSQTSVTVNVGIAATSNIGPMVDAGAPQSIPSGGTATLDGVATDDGQTQPLTLAWSRVSGPGTVDFANPASAETTATFSGGGTYILRFSANDGEVTTYAETTVTVSGAPGPPRWINPTGGSWSVAANWSNGDTIGGSDALADFSALSLPAAAIVTLDGARTIGAIRAADQNNSHGWTIAAGTDGPLTLATTIGIPEIDIINQSLTLQAALAGTQGFMKSGPGLLRVETTGTWTGTTSVAAGTLEVLAKSGDTPYVVQPGATLRLGYSTGAGYASTDLKIHGSGVEATTGLHLRGGASYNASGQIQLLDAPTTIRHFGEGLASIGTFDISINGMAVSTEASGSQIDANIQFISRGFGMSVTVESGADTATGDLVVNGRLNISNSGFYKRGTGSVRLNAPATPANTAVNLLGGTIITGATDALGTSSILRVSPGTALHLNGFNQTIRELWISGVRQPIGTYHSGNTTFITGAGQLIVTEGQAQFEHWLTLAGLTPGAPGTGPLESHDGSGVANLLQFALGGNPNDPHDNGSHIVFDAGDGVVDAPMVLTLAVRDGAVFAGEPPTATIDGITYAIQGSTDLVEWNAAVEEVVPAHAGNPPPAGYHHHTFRLMAQPEGAGSGFLRVQIIQP